jgi:hypothetical protein
VAAAAGRSIVAIPFGVLPVVFAAGQLSAVLPPDPIVLLRALVAAGLATVLICLLLVPFGASEAAGPAAVSAALVAVGLYSGLRDAGASAIGTGSLAHFTGIAYLGLCVALGWVVLRSSRPAVRAWVQALPLASALLAIAMGTQIWIACARTSAPPLNAGLEGDALGGDTLPHVPVSRPDIYHLVLDGFGRPDVLQARYGLDLTDVMRSLETRGFEVARAGFANYTQTYLSLASMLNGAYLDIRAESPGDESRAPVHALIQGSSVLHALKRFGYELHFVGSIYSATQHHELADVCLCDRPLVGEFESLVIRNTPLVDVGLAGFDHRAHRNKIERSFAALESLGPATRPRIVVGHVLAPHPPFVFQEDGRPVAPARSFTLFDGSAFPGPRTEYQQGYRAQARYVATRMLRILDRVEELSTMQRRDAVVIVHGDHGPRAWFDAKDATRTDPRESLPVLLAIRWPGTDTGSQPPVVSLVNVYRELFRRYFDSRVTLLPDHAFVSSFRAPYRFLAVPPSLLQGDFRTAIR